MSIDDQPVQLDSETEAAIHRALEAANLRAGGATGGSTESVVEEREPSAVEDGAVGAAEGD